MEPNNNMQPTPGSTPVPNPEPMKPVNAPTQNIPPAPMSEPQVVPAFSSKPMMPESEPMKSIDMTQMPKKDESMSSSEVFGNSSTQSNTVMPQTPIKKKSSKNMIIIIVLVLVVIAIAIIAWMFLVK